MTELEVWRLVRGRTCQFCGKKTTHNQPLSVSELWDSGPGLDGVRPIWPFRVRTCGRCLQPRLIKDAELIVSTYSALRPALPFAILTQELNYIPSTVIPQKPPPPHLELVKYYFRPQFEALQSEFHDVKALGAAAVAEWYKGLETLGHRSNTDAARFEQWELQGGYSRLPIAKSPSGNGVGTSLMSLTNHADPMQTFDNVQQPSVHSADGTPSSGNVVSGLSTPGTLEGQQPLTAIGPLGPSLPSGQMPGRPPRQKTERSLKEATKTRAERRKDIERRCLALEPPIMPSTLVHMDAFQAAILISRPLDDKAWEILKPRLLAQRADAEHRESKISLSDPTIQLQKRQQLEEEQRVAQANASHMWIELKVSPRDKLQKYAQDFIHLTWSDGSAVTKATASKFAAEVLCHVRQRFDEVVAQEDRMLQLKGTAFPQDEASLACRKLKLEDMKWVYEEFVKPHAERFGKELFLCHVCDTTQKLFAFEAVIQHFAAKHTSSLSSGNSIVYWKAEWPLEPPFDPHPNIPWALQATGSMASTQPPQQARLGLPPRGPPSSIEGGLGGPYNVPQPISSSQWFADPLQHVDQNSSSGVLRTDSLNTGRPPPRLEKGHLRGSVAGSSIARSETSGYTNEDEYGPRYQPYKFARPNAPIIQYYQGSHAGAKIGDEMDRSHSGKSAPRREEHPHLFETGRGWEAWKRPGPISHGSMIYSYGDSSSRFSYGESVQRDGGTSVDGTSETGGSKTTSHISLRRELASESRAPTSDLESSREEAHQAATHAAVENFLNNFSPLVGDAGTDSARGVGTITRPTDLEQPHSIPGLHPIDAYPQQGETWESLGNRTGGHISPPTRQRPAPPLRELERPPVWTDDPPAQLRYSPLVPPDRDPEITRELAYDDRYRELPGRALQARYDRQFEDMRGRGPAYPVPPYEPQYFYGHDGRRYVEVREQNAERYAPRADDFPERYHNPTDSSGSRYLDSRRYVPERQLEHDNRMHGPLREYELGDNDYRPAQNMGSSWGYDGRHPHEQATLEPHPRSARTNTREITYEPIEQPMRYTPRSFGAERPGE
ncbi:hypothetical protein AYO20_09539 [Fonsecaea nubica]|uniref:Uncharacterized protein n=1 Tax=Fonsecaea nubica TaxID=856822 RepID=A0A178CHL3_9EURO|nr:hypothetical protein AYO20_09539 [Fonsecaea nubica]OAL28211.1 hypothetical protein AYO20_09539 [Fonsecaea nubica]